MKNYLFISALLISFFTQTFGQSVYDTRFLCDGKEWVYEHHHFEKKDPNMPATGDNVTEAVTVFTEFVSGDTIVNGLAARKLYRVQDGIASIRSVLREENGRLFSLSLSEGSVRENVIFDLNIPEGANFFDYYDNFPLCFDTDANGLVCMMGHKDIVNVRGRQFERYGIYGTDIDSPDVIWIGGVGSKGGLWPEDGARATNTDYSEFVALYENGELICSREDFLRLGYTSGIQHADREDLDSPITIYDLQGRRVAGNDAGSSQLPRGIYIRDGRKFVVR